MSIQPMCMHDDAYNSSHNSSKNAATTKPLSRRRFVRVALGATASVMALGSASTLCGCSGAVPANNTAQQSDAPDAEKPSLLTKPLDNAYNKGLHYADLIIENLGSVRIQLNATIAPITVSNFADLAESKFYDGLTFHRIIKDFMAQGGDPKGDGTGGAPRKIHGEFSNNNEVNPILHKRGTISMARGQDPDSASSQFFICFKDVPSLDGKYAAFGQVVDGMDVIDKLASVAVDAKDGAVPKDKQPKITSIRMID